ncbi:MAG: hypothetical protein AUH85_01010 [Chloroflexi bacterium 13_1_40CM_4_68_4]|nr:MAG: hypothetical protein AUH85_01010 [Chloroflexi bacterium 13_1_40CM_4_68_4]
MGFKEVVFPVDYERPYGLASACFLLLVVFGEIEGLGFTAVGLFARRPDLFFDLQFAIAPAAFLVAFAAAAAVWIRHRALRDHIIRYTADLSSTPEVAAFADRLATRRPQR